MENKVLCNTFHFALHKKFCKRIGNKTIELNWKVSGNYFDVGRNEMKELRYKQTIKIDNRLIFKMKRNQEI